MSVPNAKHASYDDAGPTYTCGRAPHTACICQLIKEDGELTNLEKFAAELGCQPENAALLWYANEFDVMEDALTIFAILDKGQAFTAKKES